MNGFVLALFKLSLDGQSPWIQKLGWVLLHSLWESSLVLVGLFLLLRVKAFGLAHGPSRYRYGVCLLAMLLFVALPLRRVFTPRLDVQRSSVATQPGLKAQPVQPFPGVAAPQTLPVQNLETRLDQALPWVVLIWAAGMCGFLLRLAGGWLWLQRMRWKRAELASSVLQNTLLDLCRRSGLKRAVTLLTCEGIAGPSVVGFLRPAILVPSGWFLHLPPEHVEALLAHELAHVLRHDYAVNLLQSLLEVVFFYHPGIWWLSKQIRQTRELACDAFASRLMGDPLPLAEALAGLEARNLGCPPQLALAAHGGALMQRIQHLLLPAPRTSSSPVFGAIALASLMLVSGTQLLAKGPDAPLERAKEWTSASGKKIDVSQMPLQISLVAQKDPNGKTIPGDFRVDIFAEQIPLHTLWQHFQELHMETIRTGKGLQSASSIGKTKDSSPRVDLAMKGATPSEVLTALQRLADEQGVAPYQAPPEHALKDFKITKRIENGVVRLDFYGRQTSKEYLKGMLKSARTFAAAQDVKGGSIGNDREEDVYPGPKLDAIYEDVTLEELETKVNALIAHAK